MKKKENKAIHYAQSTGNIAAWLRMAEAVSATGPNFTSDIPQLLESQHELEIIYANIRV